MYLLIFVQIPDDDTEILQNNYVNIMAFNVLAICVARSSSTTVMIVHDKRILVSSTH